MKLTHFTFMAGALAGALAAGDVFAADATRSTTAPATRGAGGSRVQPPGRGVLPDPVLLDGSKHQSEKKTEYGMIGDFELPGDENAKDGKVGGGQGNGQQPPEANGNQAMGMPAGGGGGKKEQAGKPSGGQAGDQTAQDAGGGADPKATEKQGGGGAGEPGAQAQGIKVAELGGEPSGAGDPSAQQKPSPVSIGDKAMRIPQGTQASANVVGAQQVANQNTQVYEKPTGTGGKAPSGVQGPNRVEKGRSIPAGL